MVLFHNIGTWPTKFYLQANLRYGDYRSKLVHFETQKNIFYVKNALAQSDFRLSAKTTYIAIKGSFTRSILESNVALNFVKNIFFLPYYTYKLNAKLDLRVNKL